MQSFTKYPNESEMYLKIAALEVKESFVLQKEYWPFKTKLRQLLDVWCGDKGPLVGRKYYTRDNENIMRRKEYLIRRDK